jgi:hypothetical protein
MRVLSDICSFDSSMFLYNLWVPLKKLRGHNDTSREWAAESPVKRVLALYSSADRYHIHDY